MPSAIRLVASSSPIPARSSRSGAAERASTAAGATIGCTRCSCPAAACSSREMRSILRSITFAILSVNRRSTQRLHEAAVGIGIVQAFEIAHGVRRRRCLAIEREIGVAGRVDVAMGTLVNERGRTLQRGEFVKGWLADMDAAEAEIGRDGADIGEV